MTINENTVIAVVGLGYVGLPLAVEFGKKYRTLGYDLSEAKIESYKSHHDPTGEVSAESLVAAKKLSLSATPKIISEADVIIVAVPTPVDDAHIPDFSSLIGSSCTIGKYMKKGAIVIYESTVYPGATEDICIPLLEKHSGLDWMKDFHVGYSPERINPGDKDRTITKIVKVVSGDDAVTLEIIGDLYESIVTAGVHRVSSIKVAEAAKVIENTQRDLNIALMNELAIIFERLSIDTTEVLEAAGTKWNFLPFRPGLVGGHCIGIDPYYLTHKAEMAGYHPQVILAGRRINDSMAAYIAQQTVKKMINSGVFVKGAKVTLLGITFKENCPDIKNSKAAVLARELQEFGCDVCIYDPIADRQDTMVEYDLHLTPWEDVPFSDAIVAAVAHDQFLQKPAEEFLAKLKRFGVFVDVKAAFPKEKIESLGYSLWRL